MALLSGKLDQRLAFRQLSVCGFWWDCMVVVVVVVAFFSCTFRSGRKGCWMNYHFPLVHFFDSHERCEPV